MVTQSKRKTQQNTEPEQSGLAEPEQIALPAAPRLKPTAKVGRLIVDLMRNIEASTRSRSGRKKKTAARKSA